MHKTLIFTILTVGKWAGSGVKEDFPRSFWRGFIYHSKNPQNMGAKTYSLWVGGYKISLGKVPNTPVVMATINGKSAKFKIDNDSVVYLDGPVPAEIHSALLTMIHNYFSCSKQYNKKA